MDRRAHTRQLSCIPASFGGPESADGVAFIRDVSVTGARLYTRTKLELGAPVVLNLYLADSGGPRQTTGRVVRVEQGDPERFEFWSWEIGVQFDEPITAYEKEIEELSRRQQESGILRR
jgi:hypothetical protein